MQLFRGKLPERAAAADGLSVHAQTSASREIAQLTLRNIACNRDRDQYRNRITDLESEIEQLKQQNEQLKTQIVIEQKSSKLSNDEHQSVRSQLLNIDDSRDSKIDNEFGRSARDRTAREMQLWDELCQIALSVDPSLNEIPDNDFSASVIELVSNLVHELTTSRTETRDLIYKMKHSDTALASISNEISGLKEKLSRARAEQCLALACNVALKQHMSKQHLVIRNVEDAMRRMKTLQYKNNGSVAKPSPVLEGEFIHQERLFALSKFMEIFAGNGKVL